MSITQSEEYYRVKNACVGAYEFPVPEILRSPDVTITSAELRIDTATANSGIDRLFWRSYVGDGAGAVTDLSAEGVTGTTFDVSSRVVIDVTAAVQSHVLDSHVGIVLEPRLNAVGTVAGVTLVGRSSAMVSGLLAYIHVEYTREVNTVPDVAIAAPASESEHLAGAAIELQATASDVEDGDLSTSITWEDASGSVLGVGGALSVTLPAGEHLLTATIVDSKGAQDSDTVAVTVVEPPPPVRLLAVGFAHTCANQPDQPTTCWGWNFYGQASPPVGVGFTFIDAGQAHTCGTTSEGAVVCWGDGREGQTTVPAGLEVAQLSAGWGHNCAVTPAGDIRCWGANSHGQATPPAGNNFAAVGAGRFHSCALKATGEIQCWGDNTFNRVAAPAGNDYVQLSVHETHSCALRASGAVTCWGSNGWGMSTPPAGLLFESVVSSQVHSCGLTTSGVISCWGPTFYGVTTTPAGSEHRQLDVFARHACARTASEGIVCWGDNANGQLNVPAALRP